MHYGGQREYVVRTSPGGPTVLRAILAHLPLPHRGRRQATDKSS